MPALPCPPGGVVLPENIHFSHHDQLFTCISRDSLDPQKHHLEIWDATICKLVSKQELPANANADYQLAAINYNRVSNMIAISGAQKVWVYNLAEQALTGPFTPVFAQQRPGLDAQSGNIERLELWEYCLLGYATDFGAFAFDLESVTPQPILPVAEYSEGQTGVHSLFMIPSNGYVQAIIPGYDPQSAQFSLRPLFPKPRTLEMPTGKGNPMADRYFVLAQNKPALAIDLKEGQLVNLPPQVASMNSLDIRKWLQQE